MMRSYFSLVSFCWHSSSSDLTEFHPKKTQCHSFLCFIVLIFDASFFLLFSIPLLFDEDGELKDLNPEGLETKKHVGRFPKGTHFKNFTAFQPSSLFVSALLLSSTASRRYLQPQPALLVEKDSIFS